MENEWVFCEENLGVLVEYNSSEPDVTFSISSSWGRRQACLMLNYPFLSLFLPLNEDLCPCIMLMFSWGEPRLQAGPSDLTVDYSCSPSLKNLPSLSPLPVQLSEVGQDEDNIHGESLLQQEWPPSHAVSAFDWRCVERAWLSEGAVLGFLKMSLFSVALSWAVKNRAVSG